MWDLMKLADQLGDAVRDIENALQLEQAVYGLDAQDELKIHALLADRLAANYELAREVHYPSSFGKKLSNRQRCDAVLSPKGSPLKLDSTPPSLFDPVRQTEAADAFWLEIKVAYQFREGGRQHGGYGGQWRSKVVEDLRKMDAELGIKHAGLLLVVFNESAAVLEKDLELFENVLMEREVLAGFRQVRSVPILERMGHQLCTVALWPTIQR